MGHSWSFGDIGEGLLSNIALFNQLTKKIFTTLYRNFPLETKINPAQFSQELVRSVDNSAGIDPAELTQATLEWLDKAGYIWLKPPEFSLGDYSAVLSQQGLESLQALPDVLVFRSKSMEKASR